MRDAHRARQCLPLPYAISAIIAARVIHTFTADLGPFKRVGFMPRCSMVDAALRKPISTQAHIRSQG